MQQYQLDFGFIVGTGQGGYLFFKFGLMYLGLYPSSLVERLRQDLAIGLCMQTSFGRYK
ncbi:MAG: hypothetical protein KH897_08695 [Bacteroides sp.]|nr:hypothetical protein [Bacteroides sp.]